MSQISDGLSNGDRRCPLFALWVLQVPATPRKARHKAKVKIGRFLFGRVCDRQAHARSRQRRLSRKVQIGRTVASQIVVSNFHSASRL